MTDDDILVLAAGKATLDAKVEVPTVLPVSRDSRTWLAYLGAGLGLPVVTLMITIGLGYDIFAGGKMPHPLVLAGLTMISAPLLQRSFEKYRARQIAQVGGELLELQAQLEASQAENRRLRMLRSSSVRSRTMELPGHDDEEDTDVHGR